MISSWAKKLLPFHSKHITFNQSIYYHEENISWKKKWNLDWNNLGFEYHDLPYDFEAKYKDGEWQQGELTTRSTVELSVAAEVLHYGQKFLKV